jgi:hypothetical protein
VKFQFTCLFPAVLLSTRPLSCSSSALLRCFPSSARQSGSGKTRSATWTKPSGPARPGFQRSKCAAHYSHDQIARQIVDKHRGNLIKTTGDGILATFDGPGRAIRCALAFGAAAKQIGLPLRAGLHTGEIELRDRDIGGIAVHAAARVMAQCQPNEVWVSRVVTDLVAGAGLKFSARGSFELKGLPGPWDLFAASA